MDLSQLILARDEHFLWVCKPPSVVVHETIDKKRENLLDLLKEELGLKELFLSHRLDKETSGVLLFSLTAKANQEAQKLFQTHALKKIYWGLCHPGAIAEEGEWHHFLRPKKVQGKEKMMVVKSGGKKAITKFRLLEKRVHHYFMEFEILTGRMHQIRAQAAHSGVPLVGDKLYGEIELDQKIKGVHRHLLHSRSLGFIHPFTQTWVEVEAPLPEDMDKLSPQ